MPNQKSENKKKEESKGEQKYGRPPIVSVLGHIDHGKTTLLDYMRKTQVAEGEEGGITQHIRAYEIPYQNSSVTFIDTPGHEAFSKMRSRGAQVADIALLVISAAEGVKVQTEEALKYIKKADIPFVVVASKIDLESANVRKLKSELNELEVDLEEWGGDVPFVETSVETDEGIEELLDVISLLAEVEELESNEDEPFSGVVIESHLSEKRGSEATVVVKQGTVSCQDELATVNTKATVRRLEDSMGNMIEQAGPSKPVVIVGFEGLPQVGREVTLLSQQDAISKKKDRGIEAKTFGPEDAKRQLSVVLKTDVQGTKEAFLDYLKTLEFEDTKLKVCDQGTGNISDSDLSLAETMEGGVLGFRVGISDASKRMAEKRNIPVATYDVIYNTKQALEKQLEELFASEKKKTKIGELRVLKVFGERSGNRNIVGGKVTTGVAKNGVYARVIRDGKLQAEGQVAQLQREDTQVDEIKKGQECGIMFKGPCSIQNSDTLEFYEAKKTPPSL